MIAQGLLPRLDAVVSSPSPNDSPPLARGAPTRTLPGREAAVGARYVAPVAGNKIDRYEIVEPVGAGGMGTVYLARDPELQRDVAVKLIRPERATSEPARARFVREARAMAKVVHPNVVEVYDAGISDGRPYVVMEFVAGTTLGQWLAAGPHPRRRVLARLHRAGLGLAAAHAAGLVHRDFKPSNVLIGDDDRVRVGDFGLARAWDESPPDASGRDDTGSVDPEASLTKTGAVLGSPVYMAPEQQQADPDAPVDARADQFAFGVTLFEALVGRRPFEAGSAAGLLHLKMEGPPTIPRASAWLRRHAADLRRALHPDPAQRWPSMHALLDALARDGLNWPVVAAAGAVVATLGYASTTLDSGGPQCGGGPERIAALWNAAERDAVASALHASGRAHASATIERVFEQVDRRTQAWAESYGAACRGSVEALDASMACLERQRARIEEAIAKLKGADAATTDRAIAIASAGAMPQQCLEPEEDALEALPAEQRALASEIRAEVRHAKRREHMGHPEEAESLTGRALQRARDLGYGPLLAFALTTRASSLEAVGKYDEAAPFIYEAIDVALAADDWKQSAAAQIEGVFLEGYQRGEFEQALRLGRQAEAALARAGGDAQLEASLLNNLGATYHRMGDIDAACESMASALRIREASPRAYSNPIAHKIAVVSSRENVGGCMVTAGNYTEALPYLEGALEASRSVFGEGNPELAGIHQALSSALESAGRYAEALEHIDRCLALWEANLDPNDARLAGALADRAYALSSNGQLIEAADTMLRAADIMEAARGSDDPRPWSFRANAVEALVAAGQTERATPLAATARRRIFALTEPGAQARSAVQTASGRVAMAKGDAEAALEMFRGALQDAELFRGADHLSNVMLHIDVAKAHRLGGDTGASVAALETAVELSAVDPNREPIHTGEAYFELAKAIAADDPARAQALAQRAEEIYGRHAEMPDRVEEVRAWLATGASEDATPR